MKTTMKFMMSFMIAIALVLFASCKKDNLQDAVIPQNVVAENGTNGTNGSNGSDGTDGENGSDGTDGEDGEDGADGQDGADGEQGPPGPEGPAGPQGPKGDTGAQGEQGEQGPKGDTGTANVMYSNWIEFENTNWEDVAVEFGVDVRNYLVTVNDLTDDIRDEGLVLVYAKVLGYGNQAIPLPYTFRLLGSFETLYYHIDENLITIKFRRQDGSGDPGTIAGPNAYRYILIPGGELASKAISKEGLQKMSYAEVMDHFGLDH